MGDQQVLMMIISLLKEALEYYANRDNYYNMGSGQYLMAAKEGEEGPWSKALGALGEYHKVERARVAELSTEYVGAQAADGADFKPILPAYAMALNKCSEVIHDWAQKKGWWDEPEHRAVIRGYLERTSKSFPADVRAAVEKVLAEPIRNKGELIALMHSELSEGLEALRQKDQPYMDDKVPDLTGEAAELADTVIRIFDYCGGHGIDLGDAIMKKHNYNITRPRKHGKNF